jgi:hypothetical protein
MVKPVTNESEITNTQSFPAKVISFVDQKILRCVKPIFNVLAPFVAVGLAYGSYVLYQDGQIANAIAVASLAVMAVVYVARRCGFCRGKSNENNLSDKDINGLVKKETNEDEDIKQVENINSISSGDENLEINNKIIEEEKKKAVGDIQEAKEELEKTLEEKLMEKGPLKETEEEALQVMLEAKDGDIVWWKDEEDGVFHLMQKVGDKCLKVVIPFNKADYIEFFISNEMRVAFENDETKYTVISTSDSFDLKNVDVKKARIIKTFPTGLIEALGGIDEVLKFPENKIVQGKFRIEDAKGPVTIHWKSNKAPCLVFCLFDHEKKETKIEYLTHEEGSWFFPYLESGTTATIGCGVSVFDQNSWGFIYNKVSRLKKNEKIGGLNSYSQENEKDINNKSDLINNKNTTQSFFVVDEEDEKKRVDFTGQQSDLNAENAPNSYLKGDELENYMKNVKTNFYETMPTITSGYSLMDDLEIKREKLLKELNDKLGPPVIVKKDKLLQANSGTIFWRLKDSRKKFAFTQKIDEKTCIEINIDFNNKDQTVKYLQEIIDLADKKKMLVFDETTDEYKLSDSNIKIKKLELV